MKQIRNNDWEILLILDFYMKPSPLSTMHDIGSKSNTAQLQTMANIPTKYGAYKPFLLRVCSFTR